MELKQLLNDDRAVSPVIGVILMVAITVILAAVIGTFVLGLGSGLNSAPTAQMDFDYDDTGPGSVTISHTGGDTIDGARLNVTTTGFTTDKSFSGTVSAGSSVNVTAVPPDGATEPETLVSGDTVKVVWTSEDGSSSSVIDEFTVP